MTAKISAEFSFDQWTEKDIAIIELNSISSLSFAPMIGSWFLASKALHIIFIVSWFAGLFYIPRLFIYQTEALQLPENERGAVIKQLKIMARRLWFIITWPAMIITFLTAIAMLVIAPGYLTLPWMHVKLGFVFLLLLYHISLHIIFKKLQRDVYPMSGNQLRFYNELATIMLFAIVFTVVFKNTMSWVYGTVGIIALGVVLSIAIMLYRKARKRKDL